jgi:hypothetical protein
LIGENIRASVRGSGRDALVSSLHRPCDLSNAAFNHCGAPNLSRVADIRADPVVDHCREKYLSVLRISPNLMRTAFDRNRVCAANGEAGCNRIRMAMKMTRKNDVDC